MYAVLFDMTVDHYLFVTACQDNLPDDDRDIDICAGCPGWDAPNGCVDDPSYCKQHGRTFPYHPSMMTVNPDLEHLEIQDRYV